MGFGWFECFLFFMVAGARNKLRSILLTFLLTSLKPNTQSISVSLKGKLFHATKENTGLQRSKEREKKKKRKEKKREKKKKYGNFSKLENFRVEKVKDNL
jgi:hypothetical protein